MFHCMGIGYKIYWRQREKQAFTDLVIMQHFCTLTWAGHVFGTRKEDLNDGMDFSH